MGSRAKQKFWHLYKSERKFKDFDPFADDTPDPRFAYFQTCKKMNFLPKAGLLIKEKENPVIDFSNQFIKTEDQAMAVGESVSRYTFPVLAVIFTNNGLQPKQSAIIMRSFGHQVATLQTLNLSHNNLGLVGAQ